jgi:hypothetical protein
MIDVDSDQVRFAIFGEFDQVGPALATWRPGDAEVIVHSLTATTSQGAVT